MKKRIFVSISPPESVKKELSKLKEGLEGFPIRWVREENLHMTLLFAGYLDEKGINLLSSRVKEAALKYNSFVINLIKFSYEPEGKENAKMIWAKAEKNDMLEKLASKDFSPHITVGRIKRTEWKLIDLEELPEVDEALDLNFRAESIEIIESVLKRGGAEYKVIGRYFFKK